MAKIKIKHIVHSNNHLKPSDISETTHDFSDMELMQSKNGIKLGKSKVGYIVVDRKKRVHIYKSATWAEKKYHRTLILIGVGA